MLSRPPMLLAVDQLDDRVFVGVVGRSLVWSALAFAALLWGCIRGGQALVADGWQGWLAGAFGAFGAVLAAFFLFVPVALLIATLYVDRICAAVDRRFYPGLSTPVGAPLAVQAWDGVVLGGQVLAMQVVALVLAVVLPGIGLVPGFLVTAWAIGRGLFVAVAMRRMGRPEALRLYARRRGPVLVQGGLLAALGTVPLLNLLVPVLGVAALTHVLNRSAALPPPALALPRRP